MMRRLFKKSFAFPPPRSPLLCVGYPPLPYNATPSGLWIIFRYCYYSLTTTEAFSSNGFFRTAREKRYGYSFFRCRR